MSVRWKLIISLVLSVAGASAQCNSGLDLGVIKISCVRADSSQTTSVRWVGPITGVLNSAGNVFQVKANSIRELSQAIQTNVKGVAPAVETKGLDDKLVVKGTSQQDLVTGELRYGNVRVPLTPTFTLQLPADQKARVTSALLNDDDQFDLAKTDQQWPEGFPMVRVRVNLKQEFCGQKQNVLLPEGNGCYTEALLAILSDNSDIVVAMQVQSDGLRVHNVALKDKGLVYTVNNREVKAAATDPILPASAARGWTVSRYRTYAGCRYYDTQPPKLVTLASPPPRTGTEAGSEFKATMAKSNGITVGAAKVFDVAALQRMLLDTANQLAAVSGFNAATITGALTNIQGTTQKASFLAVQATGSPTPSIATTNSSVGGPNSTVMTTPGTPTPQTVTVQCPDGTLPNLASNGAFGCTPPSSGTPPSTPTSYTVTTTPSTTPTTTTTAAGAPTVTNTINTTTPSVTPTIPTQPASTAPAAPTSNLGLSSLDLLGDQVELNAEITTLRLLLQGALSDQYLLKNSRAVESRQQTTIGFAVALDPPDTRKPAVAEVRVYVVPSKGADPVSIMNLMPADKTYNVATVTSKSDTFGFAIALPFIQVGLNAGNSNSQLYLVKDTDTVALQFPGFPDPQPPVRAESAVSAGGDKKKRGKKDQDDLPVAASSVAVPGECQPPIDPGRTNVVAFGWQFRPVLGAVAVRSGRRQVFAQLALPSGLGDTDSPQIFVQTVWREYDIKTQVVTDVIPGTCRWDVDSSATSLVDQPVVRDMSLIDLGGGEVKLTARGDFFSTSLSVLSGSNTTVPLAFDGKTVEVFGTAHDLIENGDLKVVGANGRNSPFAIEAQDGKSCGIATASLIAAPRADGNSVATLELTLGNDYNPERNEDRAVNPLLLIGKQVYGIREYPFLPETGKEPCEKNDNSPAKCTYRFLAPTADIRNAETFLVRDVTWQNMSKTGKIEFLPAFATITKLSADPGPADKQPDKATYLLSGYDFHRLTQNCKQATILQPCLTIKAGGQDINTFNVLDRNFLTFDLPTGSGSVKSVQFLLRTTTDMAADSVLWNLTLPTTTAGPKVTASPTFLKEGDSQKVSFSGVVLKGLADKAHATVTFEKCDLSTGSVYHANSNSLDVVITQCVTSKMGHKEISATVPNSTADAVTLPIDIVRQ